MYLNSFINEKPAIISFNFVVIEGGLVGVRH